MVAYKYNNKYQQTDLLIQILNKVKKSGFSFRNLLDEYEYFNISTFNAETGRLVIVFSSDNQHHIVYDSIYLLFFDVTFAKALFGNDWEKHLVGLSRSSDKLDYIYNNVQFE